MKWLPWSVAALCLLSYAGWRLMPAPTEELRIPKTWNRTGAVRKEQKGADVTTPGPGKPSALPGDWPSFRGPRHDNIAAPAKPIARAWPSGGPKVLWRLPVGEGYAGPAIHQGKVYLLDYDRDKELDVIRCLSLDDAKEIWRTTYPVRIKRFHGMSRTVPAVTDKYVVTLGPKCQVYCCDAATGKVVWKKDLKAEFGTVEPQWYAGQCPLIDGDRLILAPAAKPLMMALDLATGKEVWRTRDHEDVGMTHSSVAIMTFDGKKQYIYAAHDGVVGVDAESGAVLWFHPGWKINIAMVPTPVVIDNERIFFTGGYEAGSQMIKLVKEAGAIKVQELFRLKAAYFAADQQTPVFYKDHLYTIIPPEPAGELACLDLTGKRLWTSGTQYRFGLGPFLVTADGLVLALNGKSSPPEDEGTLTMGTLDPAGFKVLAQARLLHGPDPWAPMALAEGRLILRDLTEMICVDVAQ